MKIEVLGPGCPKCHKVEENVNKALAELNKTAEVVKVSAIDAIVERGIMQTPAISIDGKIVAQGKVPTVEEIKGLLGK